MFLLLFFFCAWREQFGTTYWPYWKLSVIWIWSGCFGITVSILTNNQLIQYPVWMRGSLFFLSSIIILWVNTLIFHSHNCYNLRCLIKHERGRPSSIISHQCYAYNVDIKKSNQNEFNWSIQKNMHIKTNRQLSWQIELQHDFTSDGLIESVKITLKYVAQQRRLAGGHEKCIPGK